MITMAEIFKEKLQNANTNFIIRKVDLTDIYNGYVDMYERKINNFHKQRNIILFIYLIESFLFTISNETLNNISYYLDNAEEYMDLLYGEKIPNNPKFEPNVLADMLLTEQSFEIIEIHHEELNLLTNKLNLPNVPIEFLNTIDFEVAAQLTYVDNLSFPLKWEIGNMNVNNISGNLLGSFNDIFKYGSKIELYLSLIDINLFNNKNTIDTYLDMILKTTEKVTEPIPFSNDVFDIESFSK